MCYFWPFLSLRVCPGDVFLLIAVWPIISGKKLSCWLSACSVLIVVPLLWVLLSLWCHGRKVLGSCIDSWSFTSFLLKKKNITDD